MDAAGRLVATGCLDVGRRTKSDETHGTRGGCFSSQFDSVAGEWFGGRRDPAEELLHPVKKGLAVMEKIPQLSTEMTTSK